MNTQLAAIKLAGVLALIALFIAGCGMFGSDGTLNWDGTAIVINPENFATLNGGFHYENWAIIDGAPIPAGKFNVLADGSLVTVSGAPIPNNSFEIGPDLARATAIVITIEPAGDTDTIPAATHYAASDLSGGFGTLWINHPAAIGTNFSSASGGYILATPTNGDNSEENSGVWFLNPSAGPGPGLNLPTLPAGWEYEGWVVINGTPVSTGRFTDVSSADDFAGFSGPSAGPPFPGEDFLVNAPSGLTFPTDLSGATIVISVEPSPDDSPAPFDLKPLVGNVPNNAPDHTFFSLGNNTTGLPGGTATIR